jgi:hypothetical protein
MNNDLIIPTNIKPKIFLFGACDLYQAVIIDTIRKEYKIDCIPDTLKSPDSLDLSTCLKPKFSTSIRSLYTQPNEIANRAYDTLRQAPDLKYYHYELYREIVKFPYLEYYKKEAGPDDILIMNLSSELYTKASIKSELFTITPMPGIGLSDPSDYLHWLYSEYLTKNTYQVPFDEEESLNITYDLLQDFAKSIYNIFQNRVILVKTHITNLMISTDLSVKKIDVPVEGNIPFYKPSKIMKHPLDHTYAQRATNLLLNKFHKWYKSDIPIVDLKDPVFMDPNHQYGPAPFHLDKISNYKIGLNIYAELKKFKIIKGN